MGWPKGKSRRPIQEEEEEEEMKKTPSPVINKRQKAEDMSGEAKILLTKLETYLEVYVDANEGQCMVSEITNHLEDKIGKEKNDETVAELHTVLEAKLEARNQKVLGLNAEMEEMAEITTIYSGVQENMLLSLDKMDLKQLEQFDGFLQLCLKKSEFLHSASIIIHPEYEKEELIYTALCDFAENNVKGSYKANNKFRVRIAPRIPSGRASSSSSAYPTESQETTS